MAFQKNDNLEIWSVSDSRETRYFQVKATVYDFAGKELKSWDFKTEIKEHSSKRLKIIELEKAGFKRNEAFMTLETLTAGKTHVNTHFFVPYKECKLPEANIKTKVCKNGARLKVELFCDKPAFFVTLETPGIKGIFGDNSITLLPDKQTVIEFFPKQNTKLRELENSLTVKHLRETYQ